MAQKIHTSLMLRLAPWLILVVLVGPVVVGVAVGIPPAFGYLPVLGGSHWSLVIWSQLWSTPGIGRSVAISFSTGLLTVGISLTVVFAFLSTMTDSRLDRWIQRMIAPLLSVPHAAVAFGFAFLFAPSGLLLRWFSPWLTGLARPPDVLLINDPLGISLILGLVLKEIPFLLLVSLAVLPQLDVRRRVMMARSLGYRPWIAWFKVIAPGLYPLIRLSVFAVLAYATSVVDMAIILGPRLPTTLSVQVLQWFSDPDLTSHFVAAAGALLQLAVTGAALMAWYLIERVMARVFRATVCGGGRGRNDTSPKAISRGIMTLVVAISVLSLFGLALNSVAGFWRFPQSWPNRITAGHWLGALPTLAGPLEATIFVAIAAATLAVVMVLSALEQEQRQEKLATRVLWLMYLPLLVPEISFLSGVVFLTQVAKQAPSYWLVIWGHLLFVFPYVYLTLVESYRRLDKRWLQVGRSLGVSANQAFWRVRVPLMLGPILTAAALGIAVSISLYLPTLMLGGGRIVTVTTEAVSLASGGNRHLIGVWAIVQAVIPFAGFALAMLIPRILWRHRKDMQSIQ